MQELGMGADNFAYLIDPVVPEERLPYYHAVELRLDPIGDSNAPILGVTF